MIVVKTLSGTLAIDIFESEFVVTHHDIPKFAGKSHNECFEWLLKNQSCSVKEATENQGWAIKTREQVMNDPDPETIVVIGQYGKFGSRKAVRELCKVSNTFDHYEHVSGFIDGRPIEGNFTRTELHKFCL
jgi:hypothetical protein